LTKKVLIVDDSALVRKQLSEIICMLGFEIDTARNGQEAVKKATEFQYDVITMDINMPILNGIEAVKQIMQKQPTPILMISSLTTQDAGITMDALDAGAIDYIAKPGTMNIGKEKNTEDILEKVQSLSCISPRRLRSITSKTPRQRKIVHDREKPKMPASEMNETTKIVLIGSSTGGPGLIEQICSSLPENYKFPVCIVQHMPEQFTKGFAQRLNRSSLLNVFESENNIGFTTRA
jgi:two-component system chemotaxis response regulator CheB